MELSALESSNNVKIQRLTERTRLLGSVKNGNLLAGVRDSLNELGSNERSVQSYLNKTELCALCCVEVIYRLFNSITYAAHSNDNMSCIGSTVVVEQLVVCADLLVDLVHVILNDTRNSIIVRIASLTSLEEDIRVLSSTAKYRMLRIDSSLSELLDLLEVHHASYVFNIPCLDLLDLMRSSETVEEVQERNSALDS